MTAQDIPGADDWGSSIPVSTSAENDFMVDERGRPVWPLRDPSDLASLQQIATILDVVLEHVEGIRVEPSPDVGDELVLGIGGVRDEVDLYGHLTGRRTALIRDLDERHRLERPAVIIFCSPVLNLDLIELLLLTPFDGLIPGIVWGRTKEELRSNLLVSACTAVSPPPLQKEQAELVGPGMFTESPSTPATARKALESGANLLLIYAHSDGVGSEVGRGAAICSRLGQVDGGDPDLSPECVHTGQCFRVKDSYEMAKKAGQLISPDVVAARLFVNCGCHGAYIGSPSIDAGWSIFPRLAMSPKVGAILSPADLTFLEPNVFKNHLIKPLSQGAPARTAIRNFETQPHSSHGGMRYLLFGDPRIRAAPISPPQGRIRTPGIPPSIRVNLQPQAPANQVAPVIPAEQPRSDLELLRLIAFTFRGDTRETGQRTSRALTERIIALEDEGINPQTLEGGPGHAVREAVFDHLATTKGRLFEAWSKRGVFSQDVEPVPCPHCSMRIRSRKVDIPSGGKRRFLMCPRCSDVVDWDLEADGRPIFRNLELQLEGPVSRSWAGALLVVRMLAKETVRIPWPRTKDESPSPAFTIDPKSFASGPFRVYAIAIDGLRVSSAAMGAVGKRPRP